VGGETAAQATHEHFTARLLIDSSLTDLLRTHYTPLGITPEAIAALVMGTDPPGGLDFRHAGRDWTPLLRAVVSGELDADRMDYLLRDSFYTGVNYGRFDLDWILQNLFPAEHEGKIHLALSRAATFAFEDFSPQPLPHVRLGLPAPHAGELRLHAGALLHRVPRRVRGAAGAGALPRMRRRGAGGWRCAARRIRGRSGS